MEHSRESLAIYQLLIKGDRWGLVFSLGFGAFNAFWRRLRGECEWITEQLNRQRGFGASEEFFFCSRAPRAKVPRTTPEEQAVHGKMWL